MHRYYPSGGTWHHQIFPLAVSNGNDLVKGNIVIDPATKYVYYQGNDTRLQSYWINSSGAYVHTWIDNGAGGGYNPINSAQGSMAWAPALPGVVYTGIDNKLHAFNINPSTGWHHQTVPYTYNAWTPTGYANADYIKGGLVWDNNNKMAVYFGNDGRLQCFGMGANVNTWNHYWLNDYFNTESFDSYNSSATTQNSSIALSPDATFFSHNAGHLAYFKYEPCENLNPACNDINGRTLLKQTNSHNITADIDSYFRVYPNPATNKISVEASIAEEVTEDNMVQILDFTGKVLISQKLNGKSTDVDIAAFAPGVYLINIANNQKNYHYKFIKQ